MKRYLPPICVFLGLLMVSMGLTVEPKPTPPSLHYEKADLIREQRSKRKAMITAGGQLLTFSGVVWWGFSLFKKKPN
jgi:hypothetical protein